MPWYCTITLFVYSFKRLAAWSLLGKPGPDRDLSCCCTVHVCLSAGAQQSPDTSGRKVQDNTRPMFPLLLERFCFPFRPIPKMPCFKNHPSFWLPSTFSCPCISPCAYHHTTNHASHSIASRPLITEPSRSLSSRSSQLLNPNLKSLTVPPKSTLTAGMSGRSCKLTESREYSCAKCRAVEKSALFCLA